MKLELKFPGEPKALQSFRFTREGRRYQPKAATDWKGYIRLAAADQLPEAFAIFDCPLMLDVAFVFTAPKSLKKAERIALAKGARLWKPTRPDLTDNLLKGFCDALTGIVWTDDARICRVASSKTVGMAPGITVTVEPLPDPIPAPTPEPGLF